MNAKTTLGGLQIAVYFVCIWIFALIIMGIVGLNFGRFPNIVISLSVAAALCQLAWRAGRQDIDR
jgi:hypothetical protein